jgi:hypothetical protein
MIESFNRYKSVYQQERAIDIADDLTMSDNGDVKEQARALKSIIKLDKNFHIYVYGNSDLIQQGADEKGYDFHRHSQANKSGLKECFNKLLKINSI